jgi:hypothetical protein
MDRTETLNGHKYVIGRLDAFEQLHVARRLAPMLSSLLAAFASAPAILSAKADGDEDAFNLQVLELATGPLADSFAKMPQADVDYVVQACLAVCQRKQESGHAKVYARGGGMLFQDMQLDTLLGLVWFVIQENLSSFFPISQQT